MTAAEAGEKACPYSIQGGDIVTCGVESCMAWVWRSMPTPKEFVVPRTRDRVESVVTFDATPLRPKNVPEGWEFNPAASNAHRDVWVEPKEATEARREGFCVRLEER